MKHSITCAGVHVTPSTIRAHHTVEVSYEGLLAKSGAQDVFVHCGISDRGTAWKNVKDVKMQKSIDGSFSADIPIVDGDRLNICFRDSADNWDNNEGHNYTFSIH
jgi:hypothetical protein